MDAAQEARLREIIREEIAADRLMVGGVWSIDPVAAIEMAIQESLAKALIRQDILASLSPANGAQHA